VRVHMVNDQHTAFSLRVIVIRPQAHLCSAVAPGTTLGDPSVTPPSERFTHQKAIGTPMPFVCVVLPERLTLLDRQPPAGKVMQRFAGFIQASDRARGGIGSLRYISNVFHLGTIRPRRLANAPGLYSPRLAFVFFRISPTVTWLIESTEWRSTILSASKRNVQRAAPAGGSLQANMPNVASTSPVNFGGAPGQPVSDSAACNPPERKRRRTLRTVRFLHKTASATSWSVGFWPWLQSLSSRRRALVWVRAGALPVRISFSSSVRSSLVSSICVCFPMSHRITSQAKKRKILYNEVLGKHYSKSCFKYIISSHSMPL